VYARGLDKNDEFAADLRGGHRRTRRLRSLWTAGFLQTLSSINPQDDAVALMFKTHPDPAVRVERLLPALEDQLGRDAGQPSNAERFAKVMRA
jgi:Zn-dependent protease with chaperone function